MDKKTKGSWLVHQTGKLQNVNNQSRFENTYFAGKAGILLSAISANSQATIDEAKLKALAKASNINTRLELPNLLTALKDRELIDIGANGIEDGIEVLGVTTAATLEHTADIFDDSSPLLSEVAAIELSEQCSLQPQDKTRIKEELSDHFSLSDSEVSQLLLDSETIGFVDIEKLDRKYSLYFNGNLFRREDTKKIHLILRTLSVTDQQKVNELNDTLSRKACISTIDAEKILGAELFKKLSSIGIYDINVVSNTQEAVGYITKPSAFAKYSNSMVEDAFDLAKAFVSSLTYGMTRSSYPRGKIRMIEALLETLIRGEPVGPVSAIADDYKVLELKHVVKVYCGEKSGRQGYLMKLLKKEVGILALEVIRKGDISEQSLKAFPSAAITRFQGPESNREEKRRKQLRENPKATNDILMVLRTGGDF
jgi:hypothetical protein